MNIVSFADLKKNLKQIINTYLKSNDPVLIKMSDGRDLVLFSLRDYESLKEKKKQHNLLEDTANTKNLRLSIK